jgi:hypothetical protein
LRFRLFLLAATGLVPLALALLLAAAYLARERALGTQRMALELSRAIATAVDAELQSNLSLLETLSIGTQLQDLSVEQLHSEKFLQQARQIIQRQRWRTIIVADSSGDVVARAVDGASRSASPVEPGSLLQVLRSQAPTIGRVARGPAGNDAFAIRVPIIKDQKLRYVLTAVVPTDRVLAVVARQELASEWIVGVFDQEGFRVARSRAASSPRYSPTLEALVKAGGNEGAGYTYTLEGVESHTGFSRVPSAQWVVAVGIPVHEANADFYRMLAAAAAGIAASLAVMAWLAWRMTRGISAPIDALKQAATALGAGQPVQLPALGVEELDAVGTALRQASDERVQASERSTKVEAEREQLLKRLEEALRDAEQANRNKDEFLALLGHELRNPLAPITNALHLMQLKGDAGTAAERAIIQRQLNYVTRLVDDLLDASRITSKRFVIHLHPLRPIAVLEQTGRSSRSGPCWAAARCTCISTNGYARCGCGRMRRGWCRYSTTSWATPSSSPNPPARWKCSCASATIRWPSSSRTTVQACRLLNCSAPSICSTRPWTTRAASMAAWGWAWPSCAAWWKCTTAACACRAKAKGSAPRSSWNFR